MKDRIEITLKDIEKFTAVHGSKGAKTLSMLGQGNDFNQAINSKLGQELLKDLMVDMEVLLSKIINENAKPEELAEYRVCKRLFTKWSKRIKQYQTLKNKVKGV